MKLRFYRLLTALCALSFILSATTADAQSDVCGLDVPPCETPLGTYRIALPDTPENENSTPAVIFFHGAGGTGARTLRNTAMGDAFTRPYVSSAPSLWGP